MPTDNPPLDPALRQAIRRNIDDIDQDRSHVVRHVGQDVLDALRLLDEQDQRIAEIDAAATTLLSTVRAVMDVCIADGWRGGAVEDYLRERLPERERLADRIAELEQERDALRGLVREGYHIMADMIELSHDAMGAANRHGAAFDRDAELKEPRDWASTVKRTLEDGTPRA